MSGHRLDPAIAAGGGAPGAPRVLVLGTQDLGRWRETATAAGPGGTLPYGMTRLEPGFGLLWTDHQRRGLWGTRAGRGLGGAARRLAPGLQGLLGGLYGLPHLRGIDAVLSVFEDAGLGFAALQRAVPRLRAVPHVMVACWLAESLRVLPPGRAATVRYAACSARRLLVFSRNQVPELTDRLRLPDRVVSAVPFGVDTDYYDPAWVTTAAGGGGIVAVGSDSRRDYATLFEVVRRGNLAMTVACQPRNLVGLDVPPQVRILTGVYGEGYRRLLHGADIVVTPTTAPAYPSGQSVVLEAMAMCRATVTTDSAAMRDYVAPGHDGLLVPPRDPDGLAQVLVALAADPARRAALGAAGRRRVLADFTLDRMWAGVAAALHDAIGQLGIR